MDNISQKFNNKQHKNELPLLIRNSYHKNHPFISINSDLTIEELYKILINNPYLINTEDEYNETFLSYAIKRNNSELINLMLTSPILNLTYKNELTGNTYLHLAVIQQNIKLINQLLEKNIFIDEQNNEGNTALHLAYYINNLHIIKLLIENNIDFGIKNKKGLTAEEIDPVDNINEIAGYDVILDTDIIKGDINNQLNFSLNLNNLNMNSINNSGETKYKSSLKTKYNSYNNNLSEKKKTIQNFRIKSDDINSYSKTIYLSNDFENDSNFKNNISIYNSKNNIQKSIDMTSIKTIKNEQSSSLENIEFEFSEINIINNNKKEKIIKCDNKPLYEFLSQINMQKYYDNLNNNGFENIDIIIEDTKFGNCITDTQLKMIGINIPGDRAKISIRFEEKSNLFDFNIPKSVYYINKNIENISKDININKIYNWLENIKLEQYLNNFINNGYYSLELLLIQHLSKNPLNDDILKNEFNITKLGHRARILNKLKQESKNYSNFLRSSNITFHSNENSKICSECGIF